MKHFIFACLAVLVASSALAEEAAAPKVPLSDEACLECHGVKGYSVPTGSHGETEKRSLYLETSDLRDSAHGAVACVSCHRGIDKLPHAKEPMARVDCLNCHEDVKGDGLKLLAETNRQRWMVGLLPTAKGALSDVARHAKDYAASVHARPSKADPSKPAAACQDCHGGHYVFPKEDWRAANNRYRSPEVCGDCHAKQFKAYEGSVHAAARKTPWKGESAVCADCHTAHEIDSPENVAIRKKINANCGDCHEAELSSYLDSYHGQLAWLGAEKVAACHDCHRPHDTHKVKDPLALVSEPKRLATCRECHKQAEPGFLKFAPHGNTVDFGRYPQLWLVAKGMILLVVGVLAFFYAHSFLWFRRSWAERPDGAAPAPSKTLFDRPGPHVRRFSWPWRINHWVLALSVMTLVLTGMTSMYADSVWAQSVAALFGGPERLAVVHRVAAIGFVSAIAGHLLAVLYKIFVVRGGRFDWFGPDSLLPRMKDLTDMREQFRWFLGRGPKPDFDTWTYWEKFDYWAVAWGALVIGLSGLILWFPEFFSRFLPGWVFNVATVAHGLEAFLAVTTLFVVHFFNNHFRPGKFPLDPVMFTGSWSLEELEDERPAAYRRMRENGDLEARTVSAPGRTALIVSHVLGFTLIGFGLLLLLVVLVGFLQKGLV